MGRKGLIDLATIAAKLDADEKLELTYRLPVSTGDGSVTYETRTARLLDVSVESGLLYVRDKGDVIWVKVEEALEIAPEASATN